MGLRVIESMQTTYGRRCSALTLDTSGNRLCDPQRIIRYPNSIQSDMLMSITDSGIEPGVGD
jgi:hypothetical protein